jgi:hypothetical protein
MHGVVRSVNKWYHSAHFFDNTVNADHYLHVFPEEFLMFLQGMGVNSGETFFQEDRA